MFTTYDFVVHFLSPPQQSLKFLDIIITYSSQTRHPLPLLPRLKSFWPKVCNKFTYNIHPCTSLQIRHSSSFILSVPRWHAGLQQFFASHSGGQPLDRPLTNSSILAPYFFPFQPLKVHLITIFFFAKKFCMLWWFIQKNFLILSNPQFFMTCWERKIILKLLPFWLTTVFSRVKGLVTTVTSLQEHDNLYFAPFQTVYLFMFEGLIDRYWSQIAEICRTDMSLEVAVM